MGKAGITVDSKSLRQVLSDHSYFSRFTVPKLVRKYARLCAVELANRTQPFSVGQGGGRGEAYTQGSTRVKNDIGKVLRGKDDLRAMAEYMDDEKIRARVLALIDSGNLEAASKVFANCGFTKSWGGYELVRGRAEMKKIHNANRRMRTDGHTINKPGKLYVTTTSAEPYIKQVVKRVGMSKGGWAECARQIGGVQGDGARGIPSWAKRIKAGGEVVDRSTDKRNPHFVMTNTYPWISRICTPIEQKRAVSMAIDKMILEMGKALAAEAKNQYNLAA